MTNPWCSVENSTLAYLKGLPLSYDSIDYHFSVTSRGILFPYLVRCTLEHLSNKHGLDIQIKENGLYSKYYSVIVNGNPNAVLDFLENLLEYVDTASQTMLKFKNGLGKKLGTPPIRKGG